MSKPTTGKYSKKTYRCTQCGTVEDHGTNHWGKIYPHCKKCMTVTVWECLEPVPEDYGIPEDWKIVKLGDICEIK
jgi:hypothetical protein